MLLFETLGLQRPGGLQGSNCIVAFLKISLQLLGISQKIADLTPDRYFQELSPDLAIGCKCALLRSGSRPCQSSDSTDSPSGYVQVPAHESSCRNTRSDKLHSRRVPVRDDQACAGPNELGLGSPPVAAVLRGTIFRSLTAERVRIPTPWNQSPPACCFAVVPLAARAVVGGESSSF